MTIPELFQRTARLADFYRAASEDICRMAEELEEAGWSEATLHEVRQMGFVAYVAARAERLERVA